MSHVRVVAYVDERGKMRRRFEEYPTQSFDLGFEYDSDDNSILFIYIYFCFVLSNHSSYNHGR